MSTFRTRRRQIRNGLNRPGFDVELGLDEYELMADLEPNWAGVVSEEERS